MRIIGLTGPYCAGKNTYADLFLARGFSIIDVDTLGHDALLDAQDEIVTVFGNRILASNGTIDRKRLGSIVFASSPELVKLEKITHPRMVAACIRLLEQWNHEGVK